DVVLLQRELHRGSVVEELEDLVLGPPERFEHDGHVLAALPVDPDANGVLLVDIELEPGTATRDDLGDEDVLVRRLVQLTAEVELELLGEVLDGADLFENLLDPFTQEPVERLPLDSDEIRQR